VPKSAYTESGTCFS